MTRLERMVKVALNIKLFTGEQGNVLGNDTMTRKAISRAGGRKTESRDAKPFLRLQEADIDEKPSSGPGADILSLLR